MAGRGEKSRAREEARLEGRGELSRGRGESGSGEAELHGGHSKAPGEGPRP